MRRAFPPRGVAIRPFSPLFGTSIEIFLLHGNRDFLLGPAYAARCGATLLQEPVLLTVAGRPAPLLHGDSLCTLDTDYMAFRKVVRDPKWIEQFLAKPLSERIAIGRSLREQSRQSAQQKQEYIMDVTPDEVLATLRDLKVELLIHGHTHRPAQHDLGRAPDGTPLRRFVLSDWDAEARPPRVEVVRLDAHGLRRVPLAPPAKE